MTRMRLRRTVAGALTLALAAAVLAGCGEDEVDIAPGDLVSARYDDQFEDGRRASVTLPVGRLLVRAEEPVSRIAREDTRELTEVSAPSGMTFVPITWQYDAWASDAVQTYVDTVDSPTIDLVTGGATYPVRSPDRDGTDPESFYVLVEGDAEDRSLRVEFDGVTQTVDLVTGKRDAGRAAGLYDVDTEQLRTRSCSDEDEWFEGGADVEFQCRLRGPVVLPYAAGAWAEPGRQWLAVSLETSLSAFNLIEGPGLYAVYGATRLRVDVRLDGRKAARTIAPATETDICPNFDTATCDYGQHLVFEVPEDAPLGDLTVTQTYRLKLADRVGDIRAPEKVTAVAAETIPLAGPTD